MLGGFIKFQERFRAAEWNFRNACGTSCYVLKPPENPLKHGMPLLTPCNAPKTLSKSQITREITSNHLKRLSNSLKILRNDLVPPVTHLQSHNPRKCSKPLEIHHLNCLWDLLNASEPAENPLQLCEMPLRIPWNTFTSPLTPLKFIWNSLTYLWKPSATPRKNGNEILLISVIETWFSEIGNTF